MAAYRHTRSNEDPDVDYPVFDPREWGGSGHLPICSEVIGAIRHTVNPVHPFVSSKEASDFVARVLVDHWNKRNV